MSMITEMFGEDKAVQRRFEGFMKRFRVGGILRSVNATKGKGVSVYRVFVTLLGLVFTKMNLYGLLYRLTPKNDTVGLLFFRPATRSRLERPISIPSPPAGDRAAKSRRLYVPF